MNVRIVALDPFRVASARGFGKEPEGIAWGMLLGWMRERGMPVEGARFFGFNNPNPSAGTPNYGYEQWVVLAPGTPDPAVGKGIELKDAPGGLYAVARHEGNPMNLPRTWADLMAWVERSKYRTTDLQWMEEQLTPGLLREPVPDWSRASFDLYVGIAED